MHPRQRLALLALAIASLMAFGAAQPRAAAASPIVFLAPNCGGTYSAQAGTPFAVGAAAGESDSTGRVQLFAGGVGLNPLPFGAIFLSTSGNPAIGTLAWTPTSADVGCHTVEFVAIDNLGQIDSCLIDICVQPAARPSIQFLAPICGLVDTLDAGTNLTFPVGAFDPDTNVAVSLSASVPAGASFTGPRYGNPALGTFSWTPTAADRGCHLVQFFATDTVVVETCSVTICVRGSRSPDCSGAVASEPVLWPPNHKYHSIAILGVTAGDGGPVAITVTGVTQDEPVNTRGDGNTCPDAQIADGRVSVRAERSGTPGLPGNGRVYAISFTATDSMGGTCSGTVQVCVPHDQGDPTCIDDGQKYGSLGPCRSNTDVQREVTEYGLAVMDVTSAQATIEFALPADTHVSVAVFDVAGRSLATVEDAMLTTGVYQRVWNMGATARGVYFVRLKAGAVTLTKTVIKTR